jgi:hypothetical protein
MPFNPAFFPDFFSVVERPIDRQLPHFFVEEGLAKREISLPQEFYG